MFKNLRWNVLILVGAGYITLLIMFTVMAWMGGMDADEAYDIVKGPLMALIGGSLAISKDLLHDPPTANAKNIVDDHTNSDDDQR